MCEIFVLAGRIILFTQVGTHFRNSSPRRPFVSCACRNETAAGDDLMANRMRVHEVDRITEARRKMAAELRDLADRLDGQEPGLFGPARCVGSAR